MDEEIERLVIGVRADTSGFARDVADIRGTLGGQLGSAADAAGRGIENALLRAVRTGKLGFEDLKKVALSVLAEIAASAIKNAFFSGGNGGGGSGSSGGLAGLLSGVLSLFGAPGRATGGPVSPGRAYVVGENGPELFVPTSSGLVSRSGGGARDVRVAITVNAPAGSDGGQALARSSRQIARAVRSAIEAADS